MSSSTIQLRPSLPTSTTTTNNNNNTSTTNAIVVVDTNNNKNNTITTLNNNNKGIINQRRSSIHHTNPSPSKSKPITSKRREMSMDQVVNGSTTMNILHDGMIIDHSDMNIMNASLSDESLLSKSLGHYSHMSGKNLPRGSYHDIKSRYFQSLNLSSPNSNNNNTTSNNASNGGNAGNLQKQSSVVTTSVSVSTTQ
ncbi:hypothetical protein ABK040_012584 [Willaertia magna]